ncbi:MAG: type II toxin-antitoxin system HicA family toxin [Candidatus Micrarchaeia archaeon]|jgi:predicted RNA binding protein YcfA (HicA-like mRNA interferase family)
MGALARVKPLELVKLLSRLGINVERQRGSHAQLRGVYRGEMRFTTIPIHMGGELPNGILLAVLRDCGITRKEFEKMLREK